MTFQVDLARTPALNAQNRYGNLQANFCDHSNVDNADGGSQKGIHVLR